MTFAERVSHEAAALLLYESQQRADGEQALASSWSDLPKESREHWRLRAAELVAEQRR